MNAYAPQLKSLFKQIAFVFLLYTICRILFILFNFSAFQELSFGEIPALFFYGLRFDAFSVCATNALYILLCALPFAFYHSPSYQRFASAVFITTNSLAFLLNFIDFGYFPFNRKRIVYDVVYMVFGGQTEFLKLLPHFLMQRWYIVLIYILFIYVLVKVHHRIKKSGQRVFTDVSFKRGVLYFFIFSFITFSTVIGIRGGVQKVPIVLLDAASYTSPSYIPITINTPFSILKSMDLTEIKPLRFFEEKQLRTKFDPIHAPDTTAFNNMNVCVILLESFSKEFTASGHRVSYTPFLDSLMLQSISFPNAVANGKTSINSIPSVIASMPCFLDNQYLNSIYSNNTLQSLPSLLKEKGYQSVFFHGGTNGTINLDAFAKLAGYDRYYGRSEFNNDLEYDGQWGIWDEPFLKNAVKEMSKLKQPFFTSVFTLSSHNPYKVPEKYHGKFPKGNYEITESIGYADYALKQFFEDAKTQSWFGNTLFVITADHTSVSDDAFYTNLIGQYSVPLLIYKKGIVPEINNKTVQHIDVLPTVLDYLNYDRPFYSFGQSMFSDKKQPALYYVGPDFRCVNDSFVYSLSNYNLVEKFNFKRDSLLTKNLIDSEKDKPILDFCRAYLQTYNSALIENKTYYQPIR